MMGSAAGIPACSATEIIGVNRNTATLSCRNLREIIAGHNDPEVSLAGKIEADESYSGGRRKGRRGRGAAGKAVEFMLPRY